MIRQTISREDVVKAFVDCGIGVGDTIFLHADALVTAQFPQMSTESRFDLLFDALSDVVGLQGTIVMPTFTYSLTKGEDFDVATTPSTVGVLTERFRQRSGVVRSHEPIFSVAAQGDRAGLYADSATGDCFGPGSAFDVLVQEDAWIVCLGCSLDRVTMVHYVEQRCNVDYRFPKEFRGYVVDGGRRVPTVQRYLVRNLDRDAITHLDRLKARLRVHEQLRVAAIGRVGMMAVRARDFVNSAIDILTEDPVALIREGA